MTYSGRILAVVLVLLTALLLFAPRTPRSAPVPSSATPRASMTDRGLTGAPLGTWAPPAAVSDPPSLAAAPTGGIGEPATARNPHLTPPPEGISGEATWLRTDYGTAAAGPRLRSYLGPNWRGTRVRVSIPGVPPVIVILTDFCACTPPDGGDRIIDLDYRAFAALAPLSRGVLDVTVEEVP